VNVTEVIHGGKTYLRCGDCGRYGRPGWPHDCAVSKSWCKTLEEVERRHGIVEASKILSLGPESSRDAVLACVASMESIIAVWPESMRTPGFMLELRDIATTHLVSIGVEDGAELVEAAIMRAITAESRARAKEEADAARDAEEEKRAANYLIGDARRNWLVKIAADMRRNGASKEPIKAALAISNAQRCRPELPDEDIDAIATAVCRYDPKSVPRAETVRKDAAREKRGAPPTLDEYEAALDFQVQEVLLVKADPPRYYLTIDGAKYLFTAPELLSIPKFTTRFMEALGFPPLGLPKGVDDWHRIVKKWCKKATLHQQPEDASTENAIRLYIARGLRGLGLGQKIGDLDEGKYLLTKAGEMAIYSDTARKIAHEYDGRLGIQAICDHLRNLHFEGKSCRLGVENASVYAWVGPIPPAPRSEEPEEGSPEGPGPNGHGAVEPPMAASGSYDEDVPPPTEAYTDETDDLPL
jgi:hypothetical protein